MPFEEYCDTLELGNPIRKRIEDLYEVASVLSPEQITDVLISEYLTSEGNRVFESLWFFTEGYLLEARGFVGTDDIDIVPIKGKLSQIQVQKTDYDLKEASGKSRLYVACRISGLITAQIKASGRNCDRLWGMTLKYFRVNLGV